MVTWPAAALRRRLAAYCAAVLVLGCGAPMPEPGPGEGVRADTPLQLWRVVSGGFLAAPGANFGLPARPGTGAFVRLVAPTALALRGSDLLVVDSGAGRVLRVDLVLDTVTPVAGATATPMTAVALGSDLSAWVLDGVARQVLRFARDGRLMQTFRHDGPLAASAGLALVDGGATLLVADGGARQWLEMRPAGSVAVALRPEDAGGRGVAAVDAIAVAGDVVFLLDRNAAVVHQARRDGRLVGRIGDGVLKQPVALAADRSGRLFVLDAQDQGLHLFTPGAAPQFFTAAQLRVQRVGAFALDDGMLAVADRLTGQVVLHRLQRLPPP
jgi:hypothetical protein